VVSPVLWPLCNSGRAKSSTLGTFWRTRLLKVNSSLFVGFGDLDNNTLKGLTSLLSVEQEI
jgi:hypothetical protein